MSAQSILIQAIEHIPALLLVFLSIYAAYWLLGVAKWPNIGRRENWLRRAGTVDPATLDARRISQLVLISLVSLFMELLLIRWVASEVRVFAYFKSLVLIACFLGFGVGCYLTRKAISVLYSVVPLMVLVWLVELPWTPLRRLIFNLSGFIGWFSDVHMWSRAYFAGNPMWGAVSAAMALLIVISLFGLIAISFVPLGQLVGWYLEHSPRGILAYSVNVLASVIGIWLYTLLCFLSTPPLIWFAVLGLGLALFFRRFGGINRIVIPSFAVILLLFVIGTTKVQWWGEESWKGSQEPVHALQSGKAETLWSPYQKLTLIPLQRGPEIVRYVLNTNDSWYQEIADLSPEAVARHPDLYEQIPLRFQRYNLPYRFFEHPPKVLIAGAGMGNDAAAALRNGAGHVTAVEIDPLIYSTGKQKHLEHPYSSDRVEVRVDDARSFVQNTKSTYDLIVFSILDSHTTSSYYTNIRIDNYVYTVEAMQAARKRLNPGGIFAMSFSGERPWFAGRLRDIVTRGFGKPPLMIRSADGPFFFVVGPGNNRVEQALAADPELAQFLDTRKNVELAECPPTTDDWPYLYQQSRGIPTVIWVLSLGLIAICWLTFRKLERSWEGIEWHFFFLGAAFMMLEVQVISKAALLFGTTWLVNSIIITSVLLFILLSNLVIAKFPNFPRIVAYVGLFTTLGASYIIPTNSLFYDSPVARAAVATALLCSPVFFAGLIFISSFKAIGFRAEAFGSNLLGALVGGLLESLSFWIGIKALVLVAAVLYLLSALTVARVKVPQMAAQKAAVT